MTSLGTSVSLSLSSLSLSDSASSLPSSSTSGADSSIAATSSVASSAVSSGVSSSVTFIRPPAPPAAPDSASPTAVATPSSAVVSSAFATPSSAVASSSFGTPSSAVASSSSAAPSTFVSSDSASSFSAAFPTSFPVSSFSSLQRSAKASRSAVFPVAPAASSSDSLPDHVLTSSAASSPSSVTLHSAAQTSIATIATDVKSSSSGKMAGQDASAGTSASIATTQVSESSAPSASAATSSTPSKSAAPGQDPTPPSSAPSQTDAAPSSASAPDTPDKAPTTSSVASSVSKPAGSPATSAATSAPNTPTGPARPAAPDPVSDTGSASSPAVTSSEQVHGVSSSSFSFVTSSAQPHSFPAIPIPLPVSTSVPVAPSNPTAPATTQSTHAVILRPPATEVISVESQPDLTPLSQTHTASQAPAELATTPVPHSTPSAAPAPPSDPSLTSDAPSNASSKSASGIQQANAKTPTTTSTVTDKPETTLSSPVFLTVTDAKKHTIVSEPPVFTSVGVSTLSDGQLVSVTHVIANPTGIWSVDENSGKSGFFADSKAVAGVFLAMGIVITAIGLGLCFFLRRRRRRTPRFMNSISRPLPMPDNPFEDPRSLSPQPQMRYASGYTDRTLVIAGKDGIVPSRSPFDDEMEQGSVVHGSVSHHTGSNEHLGLGLAGIGANGRRFSAGARRSSMESRPRNPSGSSSVGVAVTSDHRIDPSSPHRPEPSSARSSPSLYPPTLPALPGEDNRSLVDIPLSANNSTTLVSALPSPTSASRVSSPTTRKPVPAQVDIPLPAPIAPTPLTPQQQRAQVTKPPVIPPRSPLRRNSTVRSLSRSPPPPALATIQTQLQKPEGALQQYEPLTPPASFASVSPSGSHSGHEPPSPGSSTPASSANSNPFADPHEHQLVDISIPPGHEMVRTTGKKETFYTRLNGKQRRPSVEWRH